MKWLQKPCLEAQDSFRENKYLDDREIHYDPAIMAAFSATSRKTPYFEGSFDPKGLSAEELEKAEVIDPKSVSASLHDVHILKHLFQHFTTKDNRRYMLENVAVFPIPEPGKGVVYAATNARRIAFFHSQTSHSNRFLMLEIPSDILKAIKADRYGITRPLEIQDGYLSVETNGVRTALALDKVCQPALIFPDVIRVLPHRIEVRELIGGHCPMMLIEDIASFAIKGGKENYMRFLIAKGNNVMIFAESGLWGLSTTTTTAFNEEAPMPSIIKEVWPHEGEPDPWLESNEKVESDALQEERDLAA